MDDTICAISTPIGVGGISIIRVSGEDSIKIVNSIYKGKDLDKVESHTINYGHIYSFDEVIDEVMVSVMKKPKTYTREDTVEINLHGGIATTNKVLELLLMNGCRMSEPGEFTKRAFLNGRIDLLEAESVGDIITSEDEMMRNMSINGLTGKLSKIIRDLKSSIMKLEASIEVNIDYPEYEDIEDMTPTLVGEELLKIKSIVDKLVKESNTGKIIKSGISVAIVGKPNVGKSSILNALLSEEKAIVTDIEGTTRDVVEGTIMIDGIKFTFLDTAGVRETDDVVEKIGVNKSLNFLESSDIVILVLNNNDKLTNDDKELLEKIKSKKSIIFINKNDLDKKLDIADNYNYISGNTKDIDGLDGLKDKLVELVGMENVKKGDFTYLSNARQISIIKKVQQCIDSAIQEVEDNMPSDIIEINLEAARKYLGEMLGEVYDEELIDELFSRFCLGK